MRELEALLNKRWILKAEDKELYYIEIVYTAFSY